MTGYVYAIQSGDAVKIGFAKDPVRRLSELKTGSPHEHVLLGFIDGSKSDERDAHHRLSQSRIRGEWFDHSDEVKAFVATLVPYDQSVRSIGKRGAGLEPASTIIRKLGGPTVVSLITGAHRTRVSNWMRPKASGGTGGSIPQRYFVTILSAAATKGVRIVAEDFLPPLQQAEVAQ